MSDSKPAAVDTTQTSTTNTTEKIPQWHHALERATIENVSNLPKVDHGWLCTLLPASDCPNGVLAILDITNRVNGQGDRPRSMNVGPCPAQVPELAKALLATMMAPSSNHGDDDDAYYQPRRPAWILMDKAFAPCVQLVAAILQTVEVTVKLNTPQALAQGGRKATWDLGVQLLSEESLKNLKQEKEQTWKCSMTMIADEQSGARECFLAVEDITAGTEEGKSYAVGVGPCPPATVNPDGMIRALLGTMLSPRKPEGGGYGDARRPGKVVLDKALEPWLEYVKNEIQEFGIVVEI